MALPLHEKFMKILRRTFIKQSALTLGTLAASSGWLTKSTFAAEAAILLPSDVKQTGTAQSEGFVIAAGEDTKRKATISGAMAPDAPRFVLRARGGLSASFKNKDGRVANFYLRVQDAQKDKFPDALIALGWDVVQPDGNVGRGWSRTCVRPNPKMISDKAMEKYREEWLKLPPASEHVYELELRPLDESNVAVWLDGILMNELPFALSPAEFVVTLTADTALQSLRLAKALLPTSLVNIPLSFNPRSVGMENAKLTFDAKANVPAEFHGLTGAEGVAIDGLGRIAGLGNGELQSLFWCRHATDNMTEQRMFTAPLDTYSQAQVLCALDDNADKSNAFTLRITRYGGNRGDAMADTMIAVPREGEAEANAERVGKVSYGTDKSATLWLVTVPVKSGLIQDLIYDDQRKSQNVATFKYLDVELLDPLHNVDLDDAFPPSMTATNRTYSPNNHVSVHMFDPATHRQTAFHTSPRSAAHVFGIALQKSPATLYVRPNIDISAFHKSDNPAWLVKVAAKDAGKYSVHWEFADVDGKIVTTGKRDISFTAKKLEETISVPVATDNGWFATRFLLRDDKGRVLLDHRGSFVFLPPDARKAGYESPFGTWLFWGAHGGAYVLDRQGPLLQRAGLRHATAPDEWPEKDTSKYGFTTWAVPWRVSRKPTLEEKIADHEALIQKYKTLWPGMDKMLVWHESGSAGAGFPTEMWGATPKPDSEKTEAAWKDRMEYVTALAEMVRQKFPGLKMQYGNDGSSLGIVAALLRRKFPRKYIDTIASENVGQTIAPEHPTQDGLQATWYVRETARKLGYADVPVTAAYEWMNRRDKTLGLKTQADWYLRDALHGLAYGFDTIALGTLYDAGSGYYYSTWGDGGLTTRYPYMEPKPCYAALATLTRVVDQAKFQRAVPTGSTALYALEFKHPEYYKQWIYAIVTPRGKRATTLKFPTAKARTVIDTYGRQRSTNGDTLELEASTGAQYIISSEQVTSISGGRSWFPEDVPPSQPLVVDAMDKAASWNLVAEIDPRLERPSSDMMPLRAKGNFVVREVTDGEKGKCLELELKPQGEIWVGMHEYAVLKFANPQPAKGHYTFAGVWVKGNGTWGEVMWELENAKGKKYFSAGYWQDWPGHNATNFDGWNFLRLAIPEGEEWGDEVKITGLAATIPRHALVLSEMIPVQNKTLRFKDVCLF
jgi:hypothetical protein